MTNHTSINQSINQSINHPAGDAPYDSLLPVRQFKETNRRRGQWHRLWLGREWKFVEIRFWCGF